MNAQRVREPSG